VLSLAGTIKFHWKENKNKTKGEKEILKLRKSAEFYSIKTKLYAWMKICHECNAWVESIGMRNGELNLKWNNEEYKGKMHEWS